LRRVVAFDGGVLGRQHVTGVGRALLTALGAFARDSRSPPVLLLPPDTPDPGLRRVRIVRTTAVAGRVARQLRLPGLLRRLGAEILHSPVAAVPARAPCPTIATIHDLPWRARERLSEAGCGLRHQLAARVAARRAALLVVPSRATERDALASLGPAIAPRLRVVPHGVELPEQPAESSSLRGPFLVLGDGRPRKNLDRVRHAHALARGSCPGLPDLRVVGPGFGYVGEDVKRDLLRSSRALLQISLHEGFGLPIVEAFGHGLPVVCSDRASLPEVAGDAALLVDPTDERAIARALVRIHVDHGLRAHLRDRGRRRAASLTPERTAAAWRRLHAEVRT
jgi:glycosyltransferase involved in cell wall biosynthesis